MNKRIRVNGTLYEAVESVPEIKLPRKWKLVDTDDSNDRVTYLFKNEDTDISIWSTTIDRDGTSYTSFSVLASDHDQIYTASLDGIEPDYYGLCAAADAGANAFIGIVQEMSPGKIYSMFEWGSSKNTKDLVKAMKHEIEFEIDKWR